MQWGVILEFSDTTNYKIKANKHSAFIEYSGTVDRSYTVIATSRQALHTKTIRRLQELYNK